MELPEPTLYTDGVRTYEVWPTDAFPPELVQFLVAASKIGEGRYLVARHKGRLMAVIDNPEDFGLIPESASQFRLRGVGPVAATPTFPRGSVWPTIHQIAGQKLVVPATLPAGVVGEPAGDYEPPSDAEYVRNYAELQAAINSSPAGTKFVLADGVYPVNRPNGVKDGMEFWAENLFGAIWDGGGSITHAIANSAGRANADHLAFAGLVVRNYNTQTTGQAPIDAYLREGWRFQDLICHDNRQSGLGFGQGSRVLRVHSFHNGETGMAGNKCDGAIIDGVVLEDNGWRYTSNPMWSSGGLKTFRNPDTGSNRGFIIRNSVARNNIGGGFWTDYVRGVDVLIEDCVAEDNSTNFFIEATTGTHVLRRIKSLRSGPSGFTVYVSGSYHASVVDSEIDGGIMFSEDNTGDRLCDTGLAEGNTIRITREMSNGYQVQSGRNYAQLCDPEKIVWRNNTYEVDESLRAFKWFTGPLRLAQWFAVGHS